MPTGQQKRSHVLSTERLILLPPSSLRASDLVHYLMVNRRFHQPWEPVRDELYYTIGGVENLLEKQHEEVEEGRGIHYYLSRAESDEILGKVSCSQIVPYPFHSTFVSYSLSHTHTHRGYMREALAAVIAEGMETFNLHRFEANIMPGNHASINVATSVGFVLEGYSPDYLMIQGVWEGHEHYVYINREWKPT